MTPEGLQVASTNTINHSEDVRSASNDNNDGITSAVNATLQSIEQSTSDLFAISTNPPFTFGNHPAVQLMPAQPVDDQTVGSRPAHGNTHVSQQCADQNCSIVGLYLHRTILLFLNSLQMETTQLLVKNLHQTVLLFFMVLHMIVLLGSLATFSCNYSLWEC